MATKNNVIIYDCTIQKKRQDWQEKKNYYDKWSKRYLQNTPARHRMIGTIDRSLNDNSVGIQKKSAEQRNELQVITAKSLNK